MLIVILLCNLLAIQLISPKDIPNNTFTRNNLQTNKDLLAGNFLNLLFHLEIKYKLVRHIFYLLPLTDCESINLVMNSFLQKINMNYSVTIIECHNCIYLEEEVVSYDQELMMYQYPGFYIVPITPQQEVKCFNDQLEVLGRHLDFNPRAMFVIIILPGSKVKSNDVSMLFDILWSKNLFSTVVLAITEQQLVAYWAKPFSTRGNCRQTKSTGIRYQIIRDYKVNLIDVYEETFISDYKGCTFLMGTVPRPPYVIGTPVESNGQTHYEYKYGIEIELLRLLASKTNFEIEFSKTLSYDSNAIYSRLPNGTITGTLHDVITHKIDATFGGLAPTYTGYYKFDYVFPHKSSSIGIFIMNAGPIPQWKILFVVFDYQVWTISICLFTIVGAVYCSFDLMMRPPRGKVLRVIVFIEMLQMNVGFPTNLRPSNWSKRLLFFAWAVYSVHWGLAYSSLLVALQTHVPRDKEITTLAELLQSGLQVRVDELHRELLAHYPMDETTSRLLRNSVSCDPDACLPELLALRNYSLLAKTEAVGLDGADDGRGIHGLPETVMSFPVAYVLSKGSPLTLRLGQLGLRALEAGFTGHWEAEADRRIQKGWRDGPPSPGLHVLSLSDLRGAFLMLLYGLGVALGVFVIEIVAGWPARLSRNRALVQNSRGFFRIHY